jgi:hypothetical protein
MKKEQLVIKLIQQDLKYNQLLLRLEEIGLEGRDTHYLKLLEIIFKLMSVPKVVEDDWGDLYLSYMQQAIQYKITSKGKTLKPLAEVCYRQLKALIDNKRAS